MCHAVTTWMDGSRVKAVIVCDMSIWINSQQFQILIWNNDNEILLLPLLFVLLVGTHIVYVFSRKSTSSVNTS